MNTDFFPVQYNPRHTFHSERSHVTLTLTDSYTTRRSILSTLHGSAKRWLELAIARAPYQVQAILQVRTYDSTPRGSC